MTNLCILDLARYSLLSGDESESTGQRCANRCWPVISSYPAGLFTLVCGVDWLWFDKQQSGV